VTEIEGREASEVVDIDKGRETTEVERSFAVVGTLEPMGRVDTI